jgi:osomolarity two-component system response regulator SKN7
MLRQLGYEVDSAVDGLDAVERIATDPDRYDLVILDGNMPRLHGRDAAARIKALSSNLPLVLSTGYLETGDADRLSTYGFSASIEKPYTMSELSRIIAQQLATVK